jgi:hypothetical protein
MDIFNNDAFSVLSLTKAIENVPHQPMRVGQLGVFTEEGISTTSVSLESIGSTISLVPSASRGSPGKPMTNDKRTLRSMNVIHLPQRASIVADEVQNLRAFGSESDVETAQTLMNRKLMKMRRDLDTTIEYQRVGAIKGQILDADGTTVLEDMFTAFGVSQTSHNLVLGTTSTKVAIKLIEAKRKMEAQLGGLMYTDLRVLCSASFFDALVSHPAVEKAYDRWMNGEFLRVDHRGGFFFAGIYFEEYRGSIGGNAFIEDGAAYMIPTGVADLFTTYYGPADYMETVNTNGVAYYAKQEPMPFNKGIMVEAQSNPLSICTRPSVPVKLLAA